MVEGCEDFSVSHMCVFPVLHLGPAVEPEGFTWQVPDTWGQLACTASLIPSGVPTMCYTYYVTFTSNGGGNDNGVFIDCWIDVREWRCMGTLLCILSALGMAEQTHRVSLEAQSLQSPREPLPTPTTQVARSLDSLGSPLPGGQYVAIVCSSFSGLVVAMAAGVTAAMENTFFALYANLTLMWGVQSQGDPLCTSCQEMGFLTHPELLDKRASAASSQGSEGVRVSCLSDLWVLKVVWGCEEQRQVGGRAWLSVWRKLASQL